MSPEQKTSRFKDEKKHFKLGGGGVGCSAQGPNVLQQLWLEEGGALPARGHDVRLHRRVPGKREQSCGNLKEPEPDRVSHEVG